MGIINKFKSSFLTDIYFKNQKFHDIGLCTFQLGVLFLAAAPALSFIALLISSIFGSFNRPKNFFKDKFNYPFIFVAILMILNCILISFFHNNIISFDTSRKWIGLINWIPFFWCYWGFQPFLRNQRLRIKTAKLFIIGSLPVLLSGFSQYFLKIYGPYTLFNNLIIWYQRPLVAGNGITGLFNNQNYAGAWLSIVFPLCLVFLIRKKNTNLQKMILFLLCFCFVYMIILTTSRGAILSIFITLFLFNESRKNKFLLVLTLFSIPLILSSINVFFINLQSTIYDFLPYELIKKASLTNIGNINLFPRIEIWQKSIELIKSNLFTGYGAGSFESLYNQSNGFFGEIQHSHNIFLELAINHGLLSSLIIFLMMIYLIFFSWKSISNKLGKKLNDDNLVLFNNFDKAWIISFIIFFLLHIVDITYFDGRISTISWILLAGMTSIIKGGNVLSREP